MAAFIGEMPDELIKLFQALEINTENILAEMVTAGAETAQELALAKMPKELCGALWYDGDAVKLSRPYKTPSDDGINCQVMITGYFINRNKKKTPAPLVANMFEYGSSDRRYPKKPFFRQSFNNKVIEQAMIKVQEKYLSDDGLKNVESLKDLI